MPFVGRRQLLGIQPCLINGNQGWSMYNPYACCGWFIAYYFGMEPICFIKCFCLFIELLKITRLKINKQIIADKKRGSVQAAPSDIVSRSDPNAEPPPPAHTHTKTPTHTPLIYAAKFWVQALLKIVHMANREQHMCYISDSEVQY